MELDFLPWSIVEDTRSLLGPIVDSDQWDLSNVIQSLTFSEVLGYASAPRLLITSASGETLEIHYGDILNPIIAKPGETVQQLDPPTIDQSLLLVLDRIEASFNKLLGLKALADLDSPSGTSFALANAQIKAATTTLDPPKKLAERALSSIAEIVLRWTAYTKDDLVGYGTQDGNMGEELKTQAKHIDTKEIYVKATLAHHIPTDELQQINAVTILMKEVGISFIDAAERLNIPNPEELLARKRQEDFDNATHAIAIKELNAESDLKIQAKQIQMQMEAQQAMQAQQGGMNPESESNARMAQEGQRTPTSVARARGGQGFNPNRGGMSPNEADPEGLTREGALGIDRKGETI